jgi:hypothetical protein
MGERRSYKPLAEVRFLHWVRRSFTGKRRVRTDGPNRRFGGRLIVRAHGERGVKVCTPDCESGRDQFNSGRSPQARAGHVVSPPGCKPDASAVAVRLRPRARCIFPRSFAPVVQPDRTPAFEAGWCGFESCRGCAVLAHSRVRRMTEYSPVRETGCKPVVGRFDSDLGLDVGSSSAVPEGEAPPWCRRQPVGLIGSSYGCFHVFRADHLCKSFV